LINLEFIKIVGYSTSWFRVLIYLRGIHTRYAPAEWRGIKPIKSKVHPRFTCLKLWLQLSSNWLPPAPFRGNCQTLVNKARLESGARAGLLLQYDCPRRDLDV